MTARINKKYQFQTLFISPRLVRELGVSAALVFGDILYCCERFGHYDASYQQVSEKLGISESAFIRIKKRLVDTGWITTTTKKNNRGHITTLTKKAQDEVLSFKELKLGMRPELHFNQFYTAIVPFMLDDMTHASKIKKAYNMAYMLAHIAYKVGYSVAPNNAVDQVTVYQLAKQLGFSVHTAKATLNALIDAGFIQATGETQLTLTPTQNMRALNIIKLRNTNEAVEIVTINNPVDKSPSSETGGVEGDETGGVEIVKLRESTGETGGVSNKSIDLTNVLNTNETSDFVENPTPSPLEHIAQMKRFFVNTQRHDHNVFRKLG